ncbi:hypothetical protein Ddc_10230 [Ditylenchus destructor]|nr:hypothetical protein Ddc_10230 [Ditylenchus destructor]
MTIHTEPNPDGFPYNKHRCDMLSPIKLTHLMKGVTKMVAHDEEIVGSSVVIVNDKKEIIGCAPILPRLHNYWVASGNDSFNSTKPDKGNTFVIAALPCSQLRIFSDIDLCSNVPGFKENQKLERSMVCNWAFAKNCSEPVEIPACGVFVSTIRKPMDISNDGRFDFDNEHRYVIIWSDECDVKPTCLELKKMRPWQISSTLFDDKHKKNVEY